MYTAKVDEKFTKIQELLVLANRYEVVELINYCGTKLVKSLNIQNALEIGIFAEVHNADDLLRHCVRYICEHPESLNDNWKERIKGSLKLMLEIIQISLKKFEIHEILRCGGVEPAASSLTTCNGFINAIAFQVDAKVNLHGIGLYGTRVTSIFGSTFYAMIKVYKQETLLYEERKDFQSSGCNSDPKKILFSSQVTVESNKEYHITVVFNNAFDTFHGINLKQTVFSKGENPFKVTFQQSHYQSSSNGPTIDWGQIPTLYFSKF